MAKKDDEKRHHTILMMLIDRIDVRIHRLQSLKSKLLGLIPPQPPDEKSPERPSK